MTAKLLAVHHLEFLCLKEGCTSSSESTLVKMPHCWKSHATAHMVFFYRAIIEEPLDNLQTTLDYDVFFTYAGKKVNMWKIQHLYQILTSVG